MTGMAVQLPRIRCSTSRICCSTSPDSVFTFRRIGRSRSSGLRSVGGRGPSAELDAHARPTMLVDQARHDRLQSGAHAEPMSKTGRGAARSPRDVRSLSTRGCLHRGGALPTPLGVRARRSSACRGAGDHLRYKRDFPRRGAFLSPDVAERIAAVKARGRATFPGGAHPPNGSRSSRSGGHRREASAAVAPFRSRYARSRRWSPCPPCGRRASSSSATRAPRSAARAPASPRSTGTP